MARRAAEAQRAAAGRAPRGAPPRAPPGRAPARTRSTARRRAPRRAALRRRARSATSGGAWAWRVWKYDGLPLTVPVPTTTFGPGLPHMRAALHLLPLLAGALCLGFAPAPEPGKAAVPKTV